MLPTRTVSTLSSSTMGSTTGIFETIREAELVGTLGTMETFTKAIGSMTRRKARVDLNGKMVISTTEITIMTSEKDRALRYMRMAILTR